jgi:hypothetical protein
MFMIKKVCIAASLLALAMPSPASAGVIFSDNFSSGTVGADLNGAAVQYSSVGPAIWSSHSLFWGGNNTFASSNGLSYITLSADHSSQQSDIAYTLGQGVYQISANLFPNFNTAPGAVLGYLGLSFFGNDGPNYLWEPGKSILSLNLNADGTWGLGGASLGLSAYEQGLFGSTTLTQQPTSSWSLTSAPKVTLTWDTVNNVASGSIGTTTLFSNLSLGSNISYSSVNYVGFGRDQNLVAGSSVSNFSLATVAAVPEPETYTMMMAGLALIGFAARCRKSGSSNMKMAA